MNICHYGLTLAMGVDSATIGLRATFAHFAQGKYTRFLWPQHAAAVSNIRSIDQGARLADHQR